jgi:hypothetical protein
LPINEAVTWARSRFGGRQSRLPLSLTTHAETGALDVERPAGWSPALDPTPQFIAIEDSRRIFDLIQKLAQQASSRPA